MSTESGFKVIGTRPIRHDAVERVTGRAVYGNDIQLSGMLHGKILRSPHAHARILSIDVRKALSIPGVLAVITGKDFPDPGSKVVELGEGAVVLRHLSQNCLAHEKALYKGHAVAAVAAVSPHVAEEALKRIDVKYEVLPHVIDGQAAMRDDAPLLHDDLFMQSFGVKADKPSNVVRLVKLKLGDVEQGFAGAHVVIEREYHTATVHQGYIEPHVATALFAADGNLSIWSSTQGAFTVRAQVSEILQMPVSRVRVVPTEVGGGFGGKIRVYVEPVAALLSKKTGRPVKIVMNRQEVFEGSGPTPASYIKIKMGADVNGRLTAAQAYLVYESGAYPGGWVGMGATCLLANYDIANVLVDGYDVVVNKPASAAYRAPGSANAAFASETVVDELCEQLHIDPLEFRLKNGAHEGSRRGDGFLYPRIGMIETVEAIRNHPHYKSPSPPTPLPQGERGELLLDTPAYSRKRGRGVASGFWFNIGLKSSATASVNGDGTVSLVVGSTDLAGTRTACAMQLAEALGIRAEDVKPSVGDTDQIGYTDLSAGSRTTFATGWAAYEAAQDIKRQMIVRAAFLFNVPPEDVAYEDGVLKCKSDESKRFTFKELAGKLIATGGTIVGRASVDPPGSGSAFATHVVDVEVDIETGKVSILRYTAAQDVGRAIHPAYCEGQVQGGAAQGIGWALSEEYQYDDKGAMKNASLLDYRIMTSLDLPMIDAVLVEVPNPGHPYGVRGVGEVPIVPPPAAVANAIYKAVGIRMRVLPMSPGRLLREILER